MHSEEHDQIIRELEIIAEWMDAKFAIPGTRFRMGLDGLLGLIPGIGDTAGLAVSAYMLGKARRLGVPRLLMARMIGNIFIDWLVGLVPFIGDLLDIGNKANLRNVRLMKDHVARRRGDKVF